MYSVKWNKKKKTQTPHVYLWVSLFFHSCHLISSPQEKKKRPVENHPLIPLPGGRRARRKWFEARDMMPRLRLLSSVEDRTADFWVSPESSRATELICLRELLQREGHRVCSARKRRLMGVVEVTWCVNGIEMVKAFCMPSLL